MYLPINPVEMHAEIEISERRRRARRHGLLSLFRRQRSEEQSTPDRPATHAPTRRLQPRAAQE